MTNKLDTETRKLLCVKCGEPIGNGAYSAVGMKAKHVGDCLSQDLPSRDRDNKNA